MMRGGYWLLLCIVVCAPSSLYAADNKGDCILFENGAKEGVVKSQHKNIYPQENVEIAIQNLKNYCCNNNLIEKKLCQDTSSDTGAPSNLLYDHLIDVGFRSLDGEKSLYYSSPQAQKGDAVAEQRRKKITEYATNLYGEIPLKIRKDFGTYRGFGMQGAVKLTLQETSSCADNTPQYEIYNANWTKDPTTEQVSTASLGLAEKYLVICHMAQCIKYKNAHNYYQVCKNIALERIQDEMDYVQMILINQGLQGLVSNFKAYAQGYFVQGQLSQLLEKITEMDAGLTHINNKVSEMTRMCSS